MPSQERQPRGQQAAPVESSPEPEWLTDLSGGMGNSSVIAMVTGTAVEEGSASALLDQLLNRAPQETAPTQETEAIESPELAAPQDTEALESPERAAPEVAEPLARPTPMRRGNAPVPTRTPVPAKKKTNTLTRAFNKNAQREASTRINLSPALKEEMKLFAAQWQKHHARYEAVSAKTNIPAKLIAALHWRESSGKFDTYLHQGDPLGRPAVHVPRNIPVFYKWEDAAVHALNSKKGTANALGMDASTTDFESIATYAEAYNGLGYQSRGVASPYVYSGTNQYSKGKFVSDGKYSATAKDKQLGVLAMVNEIGGLDPTLAEGSAPATPERTTGAWDKVLSGQRVLREGSSGEAVRELQRRLARHGLLRDQPDGMFGPGTDKAVRAFQRSAGLSADGIVGAGTAKAL